MSVTIRLDQLLQGLGVALAAYVATQQLLKSIDTGGDAGCEQQPAPAYPDEQPLVPVYREIALRPRSSSRFPSTMYLAIGILIGVAVLCIVTDLVNGLPAVPPPQQQQA